MTLVSNQPSPTMAWAGAFAEPRNSGRRLLPGQSGARQGALPLPRWQVNRPEDAGWSSRMARPSNSGGAPIERVTTPPSKACRNHRQALKPPRRPQHRHKPRRRGSQSGGIIMSACLTRGVPPD